MSEESEPKPTYPKTETMEGYIGEINEAGAWVIICHPDRSTSTMVFETEKFEIAGFLVADVLRVSSTTTVGEGIISTSMTVTKIPHVEANEFVQEGLSKLRKAILSDLERQRGAA